MKKRTKGIVLLLALVMVLALMGCESTLTTAQMIERCQTNTADLQSVDTEMLMDVDVEMFGQSVEMNAVYNMSAFQSPMRMKGNMTVEVMGMNIEMQLYAQQDGDTYTTYVNDGAGWTKNEMDLKGFSEYIQQYNARQNLDLYLDNADDFEMTGEEIINGKNTIKLQGVISGDALFEVIKSSGVLESLGDMLDEFDFTALADDLADLPIIIWVEEDSYYPVRYEMDMTGIMQNMYNKLFEDMDNDMAALAPTVNRITIRVTFSNFNAATEFTIPDEALNAAAS